MNVEPAAPPSEEPARSPNGVMFASGSLVVVTGLVAVLLWIGFRPRVAPTARWCAAVWNSPSNLESRQLVAPLEPERAVVNGFAWKHDGYSGEVCSVYLWVPGEPDPGWVESSVDAWALEGSGDWAIDPRTMFAQDLQVGGFGRRGLILRKGRSG